MRKIGKGTILTIVCVGGVASLVGGNVEDFIVYRSGFSSTAACVKNDSQLVTYRSSAVSPSELGLGPGFSRSRGVSICPIEVPSVPDKDDQEVEEVPEVDLYPPSLVKTPSQELGSALRTFRFLEESEEERSGSTSPAKRARIQGLLTSLATEADKNPQYVRTVLEGNPEVSEQLLTLLAGASHQVAEERRKRTSSLVKRRSFHEGDNGSGLLCRSTSADPGVRKEE